MKIVSTFMFSEPHEANLLKLKFDIENSYIDKWIIIESSYTFQGHSKKKYLAEILSRPEFQLYKDKIVVLPVDYNYTYDFEMSFKDLLKRKIIRKLKSLNKGHRYELPPYSEMAAFHAEKSQRQSSQAYILEHYKPEDVIITCDVDEIFDFNDGKIEEFSSIVKKTNQPFYIRRIIYAYDFNNITHRLRYSPILKVKDLKKKEFSFRFYRNLNRKKKIVSSNSIFAYEYTNCFYKEDIIRKLRTFSHSTSINEDDLNYILDLNISLVPRDSLNKKFWEDKENLYDLVELNTSNSPSFIIKNFEKLKTGIVNPKYLSIRQTHHG